MKKFVLGDIHGNFKAFQQCIKLSKINKDNDLLIVVGDVVDGLPQTRECIEELLTFKHLIFIKGNHDKWFEIWGKVGIKKWCWANKWGQQKPSLWIKQGGQATMKSYGGHHTNIPKSHLDLIINAPLYYIDDENRVFVHGGFDWHKPIEKEEPDNLMWDRDLFAFMEKQHSKTSEKIYTQYKEIYIGHTQIQAPYPLHYCNLWNMDTAAGWNGSLTIMDIDSKEFWQSDLVGKLYPIYMGR